MKPTEKRTRLAEFALLFAAIIWGVNSPAIKLGLQYAPPQPYNIARLLLASLLALVLLALSLLPLWADRDRLPETLRRLISP